MGIFTRLRDIINSNINAMLDKAEDPEKLLRMMIREMEDTLVEIKASCAGAMAARKKTERQIEEARTKSEEWAKKAKFAVDAGREDLAREALVEKRRLAEFCETLEKELVQCDSLVEQYQKDIVQLEEKLVSVREKQRVLVQRHVHAQGRKRAQMGIRNADNFDAIVRFEQFENRIDRMEADADLVNFGRKPSVEEELDRLATDDDIEKELDALKESKGTKEDSDR
jgi:phage shock protein A